MSVCAVDGVLISVTKRGGYVHLGDLPKGVDPEHEIRITSEDDFHRNAGARLSLKGAAEDMLTHHTSLHPAESCEWAKALELALRTS
jgi:hypothetical protein